MATKQEIIDAIIAHKQDDENVHQGLLEAVQSYDGDADKLQKRLEDHIKKTDDSHQVLVDLANDL